MFRLVLSVDACIITVLLIGLFVTLSRIYNRKTANDYEPTKEELIIVSKYFMFILFVMTSFVLEYAMIVANKKMDTNLFYFFIINRTIALVFTVISVVHSLDENKE